MITYTEKEALDCFNDHLDTENDDIEIEGKEFLPHEILKKLEPDHYYYLFGKYWDEIDQERIKDFKDELITELRSLELYRAIEKNKTKKENIKFLTHVVLKEINLLDKYDVIEDRDDYYQDYIEAQKEFISNLVNNDIYFKKEK